jgi:hypothetical protein
VQLVLLVQVMQLEGQAEQAVPLMKYPLSQIEHS